MHGVPLLQPTPLAEAAAHVTCFEKRFVGMKEQSRAISPRNNQVNYWRGGSPAAERVRL